MHRCNRCSIPKTGNPPGLLQDDCRCLAKWFAGRIDARESVRKACIQPHVSHVAVAGALAMAFTRYNLAQRIVERLVRDGVGEWFPQVMKSWDSLYGLDPVQALYKRGSKTDKKLIRELRTHGRIEEYVNLRISMNKAAKPIDTSAGR